MVAFLEQRGVDYTTWDGWYRLDAHEKALGEAFGPVVGKDADAPRLRVKVVEKQAMIEVSRSS